jgi:hypothetical protein
MTRSFAELLQSAVSEPGLISFGLPPIPHLQALFLGRSWIVHVTSSRSACSVQLRPSTYHLVVAR